MTSRDELLRAAKAGDPNAREAIGSWLEDELWEFFTNCFSDDDYIAELIQAAMLAVWTDTATRAENGADEFLDKVLGVGGMTAKATRTKAARELVRQAKLSRIPPPASGPSPNSVVLYEEQRALIDQCLPRLATPYRDIVNHRLAGGSYKQFAATRGITVEQARRRHQTAVSQLKGLVDKERVTATPDAL